MNNGHRRRVVLITTIIVVLATIITVRTVRQTRLDNELIYALHDSDEARLAALLTSGASANAWEYPEQLPFWYRLQIAFTRRPRHANRIYQGVNSAPVPEPALILAVYKRSANMVHVLLEHGADPDSRTVEGHGPLQSAKRLCSSKYHEINELLAAPSSKRGPDDVKRLQDDIEELSALRQITDDISNAGGTE